MQPMASKFPDLSRRISEFARDMENRYSAHHTRLKVRRMLMEMAQEAMKSNATGVNIPAPFDKSTLIITGSGEVIEPDDGIAAIGSGGPYALAAARALAGSTKLSAKQITEKAMAVAAEICIYTNENVIVDEL